MSLLVLRQLPLLPEKPPDFLQRLFYLLGIAPLSIRTHGEERFGIARTPAATGVRAPV